MVVHLDLKPENILLETPIDRETNANDIHIRVADFGLCQYVMDGEELHFPYKIGTFTYQAPEIILGHRTLYPNTDLFAFGIILHQLVTGRIPPPIKLINPTYNKKDVNIGAMYTFVSRSTPFVTVPPANRSLSKPLIKLIDGLLRNPDERLTWSEYHSHPWFDSLEKVDKQPKKNLGFKCDRCLIKFTEKRSLVRHNKKKHLM